MVQKSTDSSFCGLAANQLPWPYFVNIYDLFSSLLTSHVIISFCPFAFRCRYLTGIRHFIGGDTDLVMVNGEPWRHGINVSMSLGILVAAVCKVISPAGWIRHLALVVERQDGSMPGWIDQHRLSRIRHEAVLCIRAAIAQHGLLFGLRFWDLAQIEQVLR